MEKPRTRTRYPGDAIALVAGAVLLSAVELAMMLYLIMPLLPLIPLVFIGILGHASLIAAALDYARAHAREEPLPKPQRQHFAPPAAHGDAPHPA